MGDPPSLLFNFFKMYSDWDWDNVPVSIVFQDKEPEFAMIPYKKFAILTLREPFMNCATNITQSTKTIIIQELQRAKENIQKNDWENIWKKFDFFTTYSSYLKIVCNAERLGDYGSWVKFVEPYLITLLYKMERISSNNLVAHLWPQKFKNTNIEYPFKFGCLYFIGLSVLPSPDGQQNRFDISEPINTFQLECFTWKGKTNKMDLQVSRVKGSVLSKMQLEPEFDFPINQ